MALTDNLISYWPLDEASGTREDSHGSNDLADVNTVTSAAGIVNNGAVFDRNNFETLSIADNASFDAIITAMSISVWVKPANVGVVENTLASQGWLMQAQGDYWEHIITAGNSGYKQVFANNTWAHVVSVFDGGGGGNAARLKLYLNGSVQSISFSGTIPASLGSTTNKFCLGSLNESGRGFSGTLDEFGLWSRALTADEITFLYNGGAGRSYAEIAGSPAVSDYRIIPPTLNFIQPAGQLAIVPATA